MLIMKKIVSLFLCLCMLCVGSMAAMAEGAFTPGTYTGEGSGFGPIKVEVTVDENGITAYTIDASQETAGIGDALPAALNESQALVGASSADAMDALDAVTSATCAVTIAGIKAALTDALTQASGTPAADDSFGEKTADVLVIGAGVAGLRTAVEACRNGANVIVLEKTDTYGGTIGGGTLIGINSKLQAEYGIVDDPQLLVDDVNRLNDGYKSRNPGVEYSYDTDLALYFAQHCGAEVDWVVDNGVQFASEANRKPSQPTLYEPLSVERVSSCVRTSLTDVVYNALKPYIDEGKCEIIYETPATDLVMDGATVIGAVTDKGTVYAKSTVLATGGYGHSEELVTRFNFKNFTTTSYWFTTGDGMLMAEKAGGVLTNMDFLTAYAGGLKTPEGGITRTMSIRVKDFPYLVFVNKDGERFVDELGKEDGSSYDEITSWWTKGDNKVYIMVDQAMVDDLKAMNKPIISGDTDWSKFDDQAAKGNILFSGATIEEVAAKAGINAQGLAATIEKYNGYAEAGLDADFGRTRLMKAFTGGTYYIFETTPYIMLTEGGPAMNNKAQVITAEGNAIPGLYEAGEICGTANIFGRTTIGGTGNTGNLVWGALAGEHAAKYALGLE